jgi:hypothetical protein
LTIQPERIQIRQESSSDIGARSKQKKPMSVRVRGLTVRRSIGVESAKKIRNEPRAGTEVSSHLHELHPIEQYVEHEANQLK